MPQSPRHPQPVPGAVFRASGAICLVIVLALSSCQKGPDLVSDPMAYVPSDPAWIMHTDLGALRQHMDWDAIRSHETYALWMAEAVNLEAALSAMLAQGIDGSRPVVFFQSTDGSMHGFAGVADADSIAAQFQELGIEDMEKGAGFRRVKAGGGTIIWTDEMLAYTSMPVDDADPLAAMFALPAGEATGTAWQAYLDQPGDIHIWGQLDRMGLNIPWIQGLLDDFPGVSAGVRLENAQGRGALHIDFNGLNAEQQAWIDAWFAQANNSQAWRQIPAEVPAWMSLTFPADAPIPGGLDAGWLDGMAAHASDATLAFHQIKISRKGFQPKVSVWANSREPNGEKALEAALLQSGFLRPGDRMALGTLSGTYDMAPGRLVASTTEPPATLLVSTGSSVDLPSAYADQLAASPLKVVIDANALAAVLPLPEAALTLQEMVLYAEQPAPDALSVSLQVQVTDQEAWGADVAMRAMLELVPAFQVMMSFGR